MKLTEKGLRKLVLQELMGLMGGEPAPAPEDNRKRLMDIIANLDDSQVVALLQYLEEGAMEL